jgi:hypothetical protein
MSASTECRHWSHPLAKPVAFNSQMGGPRREPGNKTQLNCFGGEFFWVELRGATRISEAVAQGSPRDRAPKPEKDLDAS